MAAGRPDSRPTVIEETRGEAYISTQQSETGQEARLPGQDAHARWPCHHPDSSPAGPGAPVGLIGRVRDRWTFQELHRQGRRIRRGPITVVYLESGEGLVRVAFGIGRRVGKAVVRNKVRRRLRQIMRDMTREGRLRPGTYLVVARPEVVGRPYGELEEFLSDACREVVAR